MRPVRPRRAEVVYKRAGSSTWVVQVHVVVAVNVAGLGAGTHELPVVPSLPSTVTLVEVAPATVTVTVTEPVAQASIQPSPAP